ncbi:hypothetical protein NE237_032251 [Protea cynaroides]|uniref:DUF630 domain-containing protein n=1 Tax=Protea cynaroides TaxID=273540 RepID=A0A9Q0L3W6_9MAGN|nr:hypothetical protein NE237_032251 [Protea cynaroides]
MYGERIWVSLRRPIFLDFLHWFWRFLCATNLNYIWDFFLLSDFFISYGQRAFLKRWVVLLRKLTMKRECRDARRERLMKQLVGFCEQFANAQMTYLQALKNTGITLRQFIEAETLELEDTPFGLGAPPSPLPLPPSPLPPPPFSPDLRKVVKVEEEEVVQEEGVADGEKRGHRRDDFNPATGKTGKAIRKGRGEVMEGTISIPERLL